MLPVFTTDQVKDGVDTGDLLIDLSEYMKKKDGATKTELETLTSVVANKLDVEPQHKHHIDDVKQLQSALDGKYDKSERYAHNVILNDVEKIAYIEAPKVQRLEVAMNSAVEGYNFYVDDANGDLMILSPSSVLIATYSLAGNSWTFGGVSLNDITNNSTLAEHEELIRANSVDIVSNTAKITAVQDAVNTHTHTAFNNDLTVNGELNVDNKMNFGKCQLHATTDDYSIFRVNGVNWWSCNNGNDAMICYKNLDVTGNCRATTYDVRERIMFSNSTVGNDYARIMFSGSDNAGELEIAIADDSSEEIVVRQYSYNGNASEPRFGTIGRTLKLLDTSGNTSLPGTLTVNGNLRAKGVDILAKITEMENILKNHYDALMVLCEKHGMIDSNTGDGSNVTPK